MRGLSGVSVKGGEFPEAPPQTRFKILFRKGPKNSQASLHGASAKTTYQIHSHVSRKPHAVKFWEFLEPSPKEGSKRGLGQSPKVFSPPFSPTPRTIPAVVRAGDLAGDLGHNGLVDAVHEVVDRLLGAVEGDEGRIFVDEAVESIDAFADHSEEVGVLLGLGHFALHGFLLDLIFGEVGFELRVGIVSLLGGIESDQCFVRLQRAAERGGKFKNLCGFRHDCSP